jgi:hypothetical protein
MGACVSNESQIKYQYNTDQIQNNKLTQYICADKTEIKYVDWPIIFFNATQCIQNKGLLTNVYLLKLIHYRFFGELFVIHEDVDYNKFSSIPLVTANSIDGGVDHGYLNFHNFSSKWNDIKFQGKTSFKSGWNMMLNKHKAHVANDHLKHHSRLKIVFIIDNELQNLFELEQCLTKYNRPVIIEIIILNFEDTTNIYDQISKKYDYVNVSRFDSIDMVVCKLMSIFTDNCSIKCESVHKDIINITPRKNLSDDEDLPYKN